jgi:hypothetical protein
LEGQQGILTLLQLIQLGSKRDSGTSYLNFFEFVTQHPVGGGVVHSIDQLTPALFVPMMLQMDAGSAVFTED